MKKLRKQTTPALTPYSNNIIKYFGWKLPLIKIVEPFDSRFEKC